MIGRYKENSDFAHGTPAQRSSAFRIGLIYFSDHFKVIEENGVNFFSPHDALRHIDVPTKVVGGGSTCIAGAINEARKIVEAFRNHPDIPEERHITMFLFSDGQENCQSREDVIRAASDFKSFTEAPTIATISFGADADNDLLIEIASYGNEQQLQALENANLLQYLFQDERGFKFFIEGHIQGEITKEKLETMRRFLDVLSQSV